MHAMLESPVTQTNLAWHQQTIAETARTLNTSQEHGLCENEAAERLHFFGANEITDQEQRTWPRILLSQLQSSLVLLLVVAGACLIASLLTFVSIEAKKQLRD